MNIKNKLSKGYIRLEDMLMDGNWRTPFAVMIFLGTGWTAGFILMGILYWLTITDVLGVMLTVFVIISIIYWIVSMIGSGNW